MIRDFAVVVVISVRDLRVTVITRTDNAVQFVATGRSHFNHPELPVEVEIHTEWVAMPERPDFTVDALVIGERVLAEVVDERVVRGNRPVVVEANDLAYV